MRPSHYRTRPKVDLTPRQHQVLELVAHGKTNPEIAEALGITLDGAKFHVSEILDRLGVATREEAAAWWREQHSVRGRAARMTGWILGSTVIRLAAGGAALVVAAIAVLVATGSLHGGNPGSVAAVSPTAATTPDPIAVTTTAAIAPSTPAAAASVAHRCAAGGLVAQLRGEGATQMLFLSLHLYAAAPCQLDGTLSVTAAAGSLLAGSPMAIPVDAPIAREVAIPLAVLMPSLCIPPSTIVSVALDGSVLTSWKLPSNTGASCPYGFAANLGIGPQERGPGGTLVVEPISSPRACDLASAKLAIQVLANDTNHGEAFIAGLTGFTMPCQIGIANATIALVDASGVPIAVNDNPVHMDIVADPQGPADLQAGADLQWDNWCGKSHVDVRLTIGASTFAAPLATVPACRDRHAKSTLTAQPVL